LLFGRVTYELMAGFWPTPHAAEHNPVVARRMNAGRKVVFSRTLGEAAWSNTRLVKRGLPAEIRKMKKQPGGKGMVILGSGYIVAQLAREGLVDEFHIVVIPIILGGGRTLFEGIKKPLDLKLTSTRAFKNGNVLLTYKPAAQK
jgi:dihydrofolate reductase